MRLKAGLAVIPAALLTAAAGPPVSAPPKDACSYLTPQHVIAASGLAVGAGALTSERTCTWTADGAGGGTVTLTLQAIKAFDTGKAMAGVLKDTVVTPVKGVADEAYYLAVGDDVGFMVRKGKAAFKVALYGRIPAQKKQDAEKVLAKQVLSKF
jgi:hypothetical protein